MARQKTRFTGVYQLESETRRWNGKPDVSYYITFKDARGRKVWEKVGWRSEGYSAARAAEVRGQRLQALRHGDLLPERGPGITFGEAWQAYERTHLPGLGSAADVRLFAEKYLLPRFAARPMAEIGALDVEKLKRDLLDARLSPQTAKHILGVLRRVYRKAVTWEIYAGPVPTAKVAMPRVDNGRLRYLAHAEAARLLDTLRGLSPLWHDVSAMSLASGMRLGEILALRARDIDLPGGVIHVLDAKTGSRQAYVSELARPILECRLGGLAPDALLFPSPASGGVLDRAGKPFLRAVRECGLNDGVADSRHRVVFHTLRHTFASWLAIRGVPLYVIGELLGHTTLDMTKRYAHLCPDQRRSAVEIIAQALRGE
jgi:integrase